MFGEIKDLAERLYYGRNLPLLAPKARMLNHTSASVLSGVSISGTPPDGVWLVNVHSVVLAVGQARVKNLTANTGWSDNAAISDGGTNSDDLIPGVDITFNADLSNNGAGYALVAVTRFGDPRLDQAIAISEQLSVTDIASDSMAYDVSTIEALGATKVFVTGFGGFSVAGQYWADALFRIYLQQNSVNLAGVDKDSNANSPAGIMFSQPIALDVSDGDISVVAAQINVAGTFLPTVHMQGWYE